MFSVLKGILTEQGITLKHPETEYDVEISIPIPETGISTVFNWRMEQVNEKLSCIKFRHKQGDKLDYLRLFTLIMDVLRKDDLIF